MIARVTDIGPDGESYPVIYPSGTCGAWRKNNFRRVLVLHLKTTHGCLYGLSVCRDELGHDGVASFFSGPDLEFSGVVPRSGQRVLRKVGDQQAEAAIRRGICHISDGDARDETIVQSQERLAPASKVLGLQLNSMPVQPVGSDQCSLKPDTPDRLAGEKVLWVIRARKKQIEGLYRAAWSIENRLDSSCGKPFKRRADDIRRDAGARLNPTAEVLPRQYIADEETFGDHSRWKFDFNVVGWIGWTWGLS